MSVVNLHIDEAVAVPFRNIQRVFEGVVKTRTNKNPTFLVHGSTVRFEGVDKKVIPAT
jgi:hypothetical protein